MAKGIGQISYRVIGGDGNPVQSPSYDIFSDLVSAYGASHFYKLGVQAPPGSKMVVNKNKEIIVGRTGIYELDDDIPPIENLYFERPIKWKPNLGETERLKAEGKAALDRAEAWRQEQLKGLDKDSEDYWDKYIDIDKKFRELPDYVNGTNNYKKGVNGVYEQDGYDDIDNVIIDFIYE